MEALTSFGQWLKQCRKALDLTQAGLARCVGCSVVTVQKIEADERRPSRQMAELLAQCLDIAPEDRPTFLKVARAELRVERLAELSAFSPRLPESWRAPSPPASNLPLPPTRLLGREAELAAIARLLNNPQCRLLTLVGPGGIGKTHLALEAAAHQRQAFGDGVYFVALASLSSPEFIVPTIADATGFTFYGPEAPKTQLLHYLREKHMLLLLDNFEHLLSPPHSFAGSEAGSGERGDALVPDILQGAPAVKLLVTSRERLNLQGEWLLEIDGLPYPEDLPPAETEADTMSLAHFPAVALFVDTGQRVRPGFKLTRHNQVEIGRICRLMEGMPLGIKLAASWVRVLACREIAQEIERNLDFLTTSARDVPPRLRSLRAAFNHSWSLLGEDKQRALRRLSVFRGGFWREAAGPVAGATLPILSSLVDKSLLYRAATGRYSLHFLIRQYAAGHLAHEPPEERTARNRHSHYYLTFLGDHEPALQSHRQKDTLAELNIEIDNFRAAWDWAVTEQQIEWLRCAAGSLYYFYELHQYFQEAEALFRRGAGMAQEQLDALENSSPTPERARLEGALADMLNYQAFFNLRQGNNREALRLYQVSIALLRPLQETYALTFALVHYGVVCWATGDFEEAARNLREGLSLSRALERPYLQGLALCFLGGLTHDKGDYAGAYGWLSEAIEVCRALGDPYLTLFVGIYFSRTAQALGRLAEAQNLLREGLRIARETGNRWGIGLALERLAVIAQATGNQDEARRLIEESIAVQREVGDPWSLSWALNTLGRFALAQLDLTEAERCAVEALKVAAEAAYNTSGLNALAILAAVRAEQGAYEAALELALQVARHPASTHEAKHQVEALRVKLEAQLSPPQLEMVRMRVQSKTFETVVHNLLGDHLGGESGSPQP